MREDLFKLVFFDQKLQDEVLMHDMTSSLGTLKFQFRAGLNTSYKNHESRKGVNCVNIYKIWFVFSESS